jgi:hypothetical protein
MDTLMKVIFTLTFSICLILITIKLLNYDPYRLLIIMDDIVEDLRGEGEDDCSPLEERINEDNYHDRIKQ